MMTVVIVLRGRKSEGNVSVGAQESVLGGSSVGLRPG